MIKKERVDEIYLVRAFAIIGVLFVHSTSFAVGATTESSLFYAYNFANIFFKFGTPTFIFLSSFVLFYNYYDKPLSKSMIASFYKKRLLYILLPYLVFSLGYYVLLHFLYYPHRTIEEAVSIFLVKLLTGKAYTHLYFVFISMQFYLLFPLLLVAFKSRRSLAKYSVLIGFIIQWGFVLLNHYLMKKYQWSVPNKGSWSLSYFAYYFAGAFIGIYYTQLKEWLIIRKENLFTRKGLVWLLLWVSWLTVGLLHVQLWHMTRLGLKNVNTLWYELLWNLHTFTSALVLLQLSYLVYRNAARWFVKLMMHLGVVSFGIYLIHPLFLLVYRRFPETRAFWHHVWYAGGFLVALIGSWIVVTVAFRYFRSAWIVFGNVPKPYQKKPRIIVDRAKSYESIS